MASNPTLRSAIATAVPTASCGRCGRPLRQSDGNCTSCAARALPAASTGGLAGSDAAEATPRQLLFATLIDIVALALLIAAGLLFPRLLPADIPFASWLAPVLAGVLALAYVVASAVDFATTGRSLGHRILKLRTVDRLTGTPRLRPATLLTADLAAGPDPLGLVYAPLVAFPVPHASESQALAAARNHAGQTAFVLTFESGVEFYIDREAIIGRGPEQRHAKTASARPYVLSDLSRTVSNSHLRVEPAEGGLLVTDLGSLRGTAVFSPEGTRHILVPGQATAIKPGASIFLGQRMAKVSQADAVASSAPVTAPAGGAHRGE